MLFGLFVVICIVLVMSESQTGELPGKSRAGTLHWKTPWNLNHHFCGIHIFQDNNQLFPFDCVRNFNTLQYYSSENC